MSIPTTTEWQLKRLLDKLYHTMAYKRFQGLFIQGFYIRPDAIDRVDFQLNSPRVIKTLTKAEIQWFSDTFFVEEHAALQVPFKDKVLAVGFWADNLDELKQWIQEQIPDVDTLTTAERSLTGYVYVD